jgi:hypothetical protein
MKVLQEFQTCYSKHEGSHSSLVNEFVINAYVLWADTHASQITNHMTRTWLRNKANVECFALSKFTSKFLTSAIADGKQLEMEWNWAWQVIMEDQLLVD